jgi:VWFA-related protein
MRSSVPDQTRLHDPLDDEAGPKDGIEHRIAPYSTDVRRIRSWATIAFLLAVSGGVGAQTPPTFPTKVELVTVDVVVVDDKGVPVPGLTRDDFVIEEDGRPQPIVSFEAVVAEEATKAPPTTKPAAVATNDVERPRIGRAYALVLDDLGLDLGAAEGARRAVTSFLARSVRDGDEVIMATTSGDAWWSTRIPEGRDDLLAIAARLRSRGGSVSHALEYMTESEAYLISRGNVISQQIVDRVVSRWTLARVCLERDPGCSGKVVARAGQIDGERRMRTQAILATVRRAIDALASVRGRKSLLLFSRGFLEDTELRPRDVVAASREANTAVYFVDARGLVVGPGSASADTAIAPAVADLGRMSFEETVLSSLGSQALAEDTGGFSIRNSNDLAAGTERIAAESRVFYMLGFEAPADKRPREWRKLRVEVKRAGLKVRARRGYTLRAERPPPAKPVPAKEGTRALPAAVETALDMAREVTGIPLRATTYVLEPRGKDTTRVMIAAEFDATHLTFQGAGKSRAARVEVTAAATLRDTGKTFYSDERVEVRVAEGETPGWRSVAREFDLPAGVAQARLVVRDPATGAMGAVAQRFQVPAPGNLRLSTPILSDQVIRPTTRDDKPRAAVAAHRTFAPGGGLYCEFEVFGAPRDPADGAPRVSSGLEVRAADGTAVRQAPPTRIAADREGRVARLVGLDLGGLAEGPYELVLDVRDEVGGGRIERREPFTIGR